MIRLLLLALIVYGVYRWLKPRLSPSWQRDGEAVNAHEAELIRDPECGAYFLRNKGVSVRIDGESVFFCSPQCRDTYLEKRKKESKRA
ncbi:transcriptional regulator [Desulfosoma caldarium]|uniref:TRASH domain-containing protein n=1 Tax=Desulfosoma caldarium TaxID=610254 RepID=A0A3N1UM11_9BACT|nr:transcriptional regulator [Desulfosoma caldarium]ROQ92254.1 hypothetical protein EDC27_1956 [Desulfosoma caldarium]